VVAGPKPGALKKTDVYVGKIALSVDDDVVMALLSACGEIKSWKRMQDPETGKPKGFGFCEFEDAEGVLRALRLLNNLSLDGQELLVKCNTATQVRVLPVPCPRMHLHGFGWWVEARALAPRSSSHPAWRRRCLAPSSMASAPEIFSSADCTERLGCGRASLGTISPRRVSH
jgi:RNA recognition motif. (a.k.a. RRM, RBD, or RNP domain)